MTARERSAKSVTRSAVRARRAARGATTAAAVEAALAGHLASALQLCVAGRGPVQQSSVAVYESLPGEPGTRPVREELRRRGHGALLPVLLPDLDLDWVRDPGPDAAGDPLRPHGPRLGRDALLACALVLVPALAVDRSGTRLGQGGGSYDRALVRLGSGASRPLVLAVVHDDEVLDDPLPRETHDVSVDGALTPSGLVLLR